MGAGRRHARTDAERQPALEYVEVRARERAEERREAEPGKPSHTARQEAPAKGRREAAAAPDGGYSEAGWGGGRYDGQKRSQRKRNPGGENANNNEDGDGIVLVVVVFVGVCDLFAPVG